MPHPPPDTLRKITDHMVQDVVAGEARRAVGKKVCKYFCQIFFEKLHEQVPALTGQDSPDIGTVVPEMIQNVCEPVAQIPGLTGKIVGALHAELFRKNMGKDIRTQRSQQLIFCLK